METPFIEIEGSPDLIRDMGSKALLNTDRRALDRYMQQRAKMQQADKAEAEVQELKNQIASLSNEMKEIKNLLKGLGNK